MQIFWQVNLRTKNTYNLNINTSHYQFPFISRCTHCTPCPGTLLLSSFSCSSSLLYQKVSNSSTRNFLMLTVAPAHKIIYIKLCLSHLWIIQDRTNSWPVLPQISTARNNSRRGRSADVQSAANPSPLLFTPSQDWVIPIWGNHGLLKSSHFQGIEAIP